MSIFTKKPNPTSKTGQVCGLASLLKDSTLRQNIQVQIRRKIDSIHAVEP